MMANKLRAKRLYWEVGHTQLPVPRLTTRISKLREID